MMAASDRKIQDCSGTPMSSKVLLEETFYLLTKKSTVFRVQLRTDGLCLLKDNNEVVKKQVIPIADIIGCHSARSKKSSRNTASSCVCQSLPQQNNSSGGEGEQNDDESDISAYLYIYAYLLGQKKRQRTTITLRFRSFDKYQDNNCEAQRWRCVIKSLIGGENVSKLPSLTEKLMFVNDVAADEKKKLLIFLNPKSGPGKARTVFQQKVAPILQEADMQYDLHITKYANFAREFVRTNDVYQWSGIVVVGGDGIVFEVINGLLERTDWSLALRHLPIGVLPCGSGNGLARAVCHAYNEPYSLVGSILAIVHRRTCPMDLVRVETTTRIMYSFLSVGWGLLSDIDIESERFRAIGGQRFTVWSLARLLDLRTYRGHLWYLPVTTADLEDVIITTADIDLDSSNMNTPRERLDSWYSAASRRSAYFSANGSSYQSLEAPAGMYGPPSRLPALTAPLPSHWTLIKGNFVMVHAAYQTHLAQDCMFAPGAGLNDGVIWLVILRAGLSRAQLLTFLLGLSSGAHAPRGNSTGELIEMVAVKAFRLVPDTAPDNVGHLTVDGESVEYGPVQAEVCPSLASVMVP